MLATLVFIQLILTIAGLLLVRSGLRAEAADYLHTAGTIRLILGGSALCFAVGCLVAIVALELSLV